MVRLLLDSNVLGMLSHPKEQPFERSHQRLQRIVSENIVQDVYIPEIADYELRRKLLHLEMTGRASTALQRLDELAVLFKFLPISRTTFRSAARLWAQARVKGRSTAHPHSFDADVVLAAQALEVDGFVVTTNERHLSIFVRTIAIEF